MNIFDVTKSEQGPVTEIRWTTEAAEEDHSYNLILRSSGGVTLKDEGLEDILNGDSALCENAVEAESLIKALQKAIDLGWFR